MLAGAVVCLLLAALIGGSGLWTLARRPPDDLTGVVMRMVAPTQLAAAVMLAAGAAVALAGPARFAVPALLAGAVGAIGTVAAGSWQGARYAARRESAAACASGGVCSGCTNTCEPSSG